MKLGFASLIGVEPMPFADLVFEASKRGLTALEVNVGPKFPHIDGASYPGHLDLSAIVEHGAGPVEEMLGDSGITIASLAPMLNLLTADPSLRAERIAYLRLTIDACVKLGVRNVVTFTGSAYGMRLLGDAGRRRPSLIESGCRQHPALSRCLRPTRTLRRGTRDPDRFRNGGPGWFRGQLGSQPGALGSNV